MIGFIRYFGHVGWISLNKSLFLIEVESSCQNFSVSIVIDTDRLVIIAIVLGRYGMGIVRFR
jgi:hypothetical protein